MITANLLAERIRKHRGDAWKSPTGDGICAGDPGIFVTGIVTTFAPTFDVLRRAVAKGANLIVSRELPFWGRPATAPVMRGNPTFEAKQQFIENNKLTIYRLRENWDGQERAL